MAILKRIKILTKSEISDFFGPPVLTADEQSDVTSLNNQNSLLNEEITSFKTQVDSMSDQLQSKDSLLIQLKDEMKQQISKNGQLAQEILTAKVELKARNDIFEEIQGRFKV